MKSSSYMTRALRSNDRRYAAVLGKLGYVAPLNIRTPKQDPLDHDGDGRKGGSSKPEPSRELTELRAEYERLIGKRPFHGWGADELKAKLAEAVAD